MQDIDTRDYRAVAFALVQIFHKMFPDGDSFYIPRVVTDVYHMFNGHFDNLQPIDTKYHDLEHTLQASMCFARLMTNRHFEGVEPKMTEHDFRRGLVAIMLHDSGYLKREGDNEGTGAKYTAIHEQRSCEFAAQYLQDFSWDHDSIVSVQHMISCTGPNSDIGGVPFHTTIDYVMGQAICTADYVGQMSDPSYVGKLYHLFLEFKESDDYQHVPAEKRIFTSYEKLLEMTPNFWEKIVKPRLYVECRNLYKYLATDEKKKKNPYADAIEENIESVRKMIANNSLSAAADKLISN